MAYNHMFRMLLWGPEYQSKMTMPSSPRARLCPANRTAGPSFSNAIAAGDAAEFFAKAAEALDAVDAEDDDDAAAACC